MASSPPAGPQLRGGATPVSRASYVGKVSSLYVFLLVDAALNAIADMTAISLPLLAFVTFLQTLVRFLVLMLLLLLTTATALFKSGLLGILWRQFGWFFGVGALSFALMIATRAYRLTLLASQVPPATYFQYSSYFGLYIVHNLCSVIYYHLAIAATFRLSDPSFYDPQAWLRN